MEQSSALFASQQQEQEAIRIYRQQQDFEYKVLESALDVDAGGDAIAIRLNPGKDTFAASSDRRRLVWDVFAPFYNCPLKQRVGTPPICL